MADVVKFGVQVANRIFVGGIPFDAKEYQLRDFFSKFGNIRDVTIVKDERNLSRGFAFVTFESKLDAMKTQKLGNVFYKEKKLNLGPAIRQKGVVYNGAELGENEPVKSTSVHISSTINSKMLDFEGGEYDVVEIRGVLKYKSAVEQS